jgi:hypothetical protein
MYSLPTNLTRRPFSCVGLASYNSCSCSEGSLSTLETQFVGTAVEAWNVKHRPHFCADDVTGRNKSRLNQARKSTVSKTPLHILRHSEKSDNRNCSHFPFRLSSYAASKVRIVRKSSQNFYEGIGVLQFHNLPN